MGDIVNSVADVLGFGPASKQAGAVKSAASTSAAATRYAQDLQKQMFDKQIELQAPYREAGLTAQNRLLDLLGLSQNTGAAGYGSAARNFGMADFQTDPGYGFRMSEGMKALERSAAARGGLLSGGTLKGIQRYGQGLASDEYQNAFNRYQTNRASMLNPLQSIAGYGQTSSNALGSAASAYGSNVGNLAMTNAANQGNALLAGGNIRASQYGTLGRGIDQAMNTNWSGIGNSLNSWLNSSGYGGGGGMSYDAYTAANPDQGLL